MFWDENYHVASAQKHIDGVMYMEPHPPLGKMLMAVGEVLFGDNSAVNKNALNTTDYLTGENAPPAMTYKGFRFPSVVMMAFAALFFYGILNRITQLPWLAALGSSLVIFDNALVIQARAAMLEGIQLFFVLGALYYAVKPLTQWLNHQSPITLKHYAWLGLWIGLATAVKVTSLILVLCFVFLYAVEHWKLLQNQQWGALLQGLLTRVPAGVLPLVASFLTVFYIHIGMGTQVLQNRTYKASPEYLEQIRQKNTWAPSTFVTALKDNFKYMNEYADGVPRLDVCKSDENGSYALGWPLGTKTISFRRDKSTENGIVSVRYKYLLSNPVVWFSVFGGIILSIGLLISHFVYGAPLKNAPLFYWIAAFTTLYVCYMAAILQIERVMYMYHYLVALVFGAINLVLVYHYIYQQELISLNKHTLINTCAFVVLAVAVFAYFSPFTYGFGLTEEQFELRNWFNFWQMQVVR